MLVGRASKRVSDATTRRLFDHDPLFAVLRALDAFATPTAPVREELVFAALAIPLAIRAVGWPRLPERVPESLKHAAGGSRRLHLAGDSWRRLDAELARYDAWWRSLPLFRTRVFVGEEHAFERRRRTISLGRGLVLLERRRRERTAGAARLLAVHARRALRLVRVDAPPGADDDAKRGQRRRNAATKEGTIERRRTRSWSS